MNPTESFAHALRVIRERGGYTSAHAFYKSQGGRLFFGCTYRQYLNVESGLSSPGPQLAEKIATALGLRMDREGSREFFMAYLRTMVNRPTLVELIVSALSENNPAAASQTPLHRSLVRHFVAKTVPLTRGQSDALMAHPESYWVFSVLANDDGLWTAEDLSLQLGMPEAAVKNSLKTLLRLKLVSKDPEGRFSTPLMDRVVLHPRDDFHAPRLEKLRALWSKMASSKGQRVFSQHLFTRASEADLREYFPQLTSSVQAAEICSTTRKGRDTGFFLIQASVDRLMPF